MSCKLFVANFPYSSTNEELQGSDRLSVCAEMVLNVSGHVLGARLPLVLIGTMKLKFGAFDFVDPRDGLFFPRVGLSRAGGQPAGQR